MEEPKAGEVKKRAWFVLHVKPRTEKKVVQWLEHYGYFRHLPLYVKVTKVQRRKVRRYLPLFPGYVFTKFYPDERYKMLQTGLIVTTIPVPQPRVMVHQLRQIKNATRTARVVKVSHSFKAGDRVRIVGGMMRGTEGVVNRDGPMATLCLNVDILGVGVEVEVSPCDLELAERC